jgi:5-methyltetrahydrofolate--homocysteine methyltransferase
MLGILERLRSGDILVADGAMGTMLFERGLKPGECPERWNLERPQVLEEIARLYLEAGADILQTNTFGASPLKLAQYSLSDSTEAINVAAVRAARSAATGRAFISASCGPCGRLLKPYGDVDPEEVTEGFERQLSAVVAEGVDMICIETMTDLSEATLAVRAAKKVSPATLVAATMTFDATARGFFTIMGVTVMQAARDLAAAGADIVGSNCGNGIENMVRIAAEFRKHSALPLLIQSNAGLPETTRDGLVYPESPEFMAAACPELVAFGVGIIGGCCGTTPEHVAAIRKTVDAFRKP